MKIQEPEIYEIDSGLENYDKVDVLVIKLGYGLTPLVMPEKHQDKFFNIIKLVKRELENKYGLVFPKTRICDDSELGSDGYAIYINGVKAAQFAGMPYYSYLCLDLDCRKDGINGKVIKDPICKQDSIVLSEEEALKAKEKGYKVFDFLNVFRAHYNTVLQENRTKILNQHLVNELIHIIRSRNPDVVDEVLYSKNYSISEIKIILNLLLKESVSIHDIQTILETLADYIEHKGEAVYLAGKIRKRFARQILFTNSDHKQELHVIKLSQEMNDFLSGKMKATDSKIEIPVFDLSPDEKQKINDKIDDVIKNWKDEELDPVFLCSDNIRFALSDYYRCKNYSCISEDEFYEAGYDFSLKIEETLSYE